LNSLIETPGHVVRFHVPLIPAKIPFALPITCQNKDSPGSNAMGELDVVAPVSNHITLRTLQFQCLRGPLNHSGIWFSAPALLSVRRRSHIGVMRTVTDAVKMGPFLS
jgi:hypothetical protein